MASKARSLTDALHGKADALLGKSVKHATPATHPVDATPTASEPPPVKTQADPSESDLVDRSPGLTLYLTRHSWRQLKELGMDVRKPVHTLLIEAVNLLFEKHGRPQVAQAGRRPEVKPKK